MREYEVQYRITITGKHYVTAQDEDAASDQFQEDLNRNERRFIDDAMLNGNAQVDDSEVEDTTDLGEAEEEEDEE